MLVVLASHGALSALPASIGAVTNLFAKGYFGVTIFFTISGFLITRNALQRYGELGQIQIGQFYAMRVARILPCLLLFLTIMTLLFWSGVDGFVPAEPKLIVAGIWNAIIFQYNNFYLSTDGGNVPGMFAWSPLWSLSIEETFYLVFPVACLVSRKTSVYAAGALVLIVYGPYARAGHAGLYHYFGNADLLSFGCLAALAERRLASLHLTKQYGWLLCVIGGSLALATIILSSVEDDRPLAPTIIAFGAATFLIGATYFQNIRVLRCFLPLTLVLAAFGRASYEIYLFHVALIIAFKEALLSSGFTGAGMTAILFGVLLVSGEMISHGFSEPLRKMIRAALAPQSQIALQGVKP